LKFKRKPCKVAKKYEQGKCKKGSWHKRHKRTLLFPINKVVDMKKTSDVEKEIFSNENLLKKSLKKTIMKELASP
jgi:hypothetical protein